MFFRARFYFHGFQFILQAFLSFQADCWNSKSKWYNTADRISASGVIILGPVSFSHPGPVSFRLTYPPPPPLHDGGFSFLYLFFIFSVSLFLFLFLKKMRIILFPIAGVTFKLQAFFLLVISGWVLSWSRKSKCQKEYAIRHTCWHISGFLSVYLYADRIIYNRTFDNYWPFQSQFWKFGA